MIAEKYRSAGADYVTKHGLLTGDHDGPAPVGIWHAEKIIKWAQSAIDDNHLAKAETDEVHATAVTVANAAERSEQDTITQLTAAGGDRSAVITEQLKSARKDQKLVEEDRRQFETRLSVFELTLPTSSGDVTLTHASLVELTAQEQTLLRETSEQASKAAGRLWQLRQNVTATEREITGLRARRSLIPEDADGCRNRIASALDIDTDRLRYAGELLQLKPEHRRWEKAVIGLLLPLSSTLLVESHDFVRVRRYVHDHDMHGSITITPARPGSPRPAPMDSGIPALLDIADHPFQGWLAAELNETANYFCVETDADLDDRHPAWARGSITPVGMRTGSRNRLTKDDRRLRYPWIGWDTRRLLQELDSELESTQRELEGAKSVADQADLRRESARARLDELGALNTDLSWDRIDTSATVQRIGELEAQLVLANSPEIAHLVALLRTQRETAVVARGEVQQLEERQKGLNEQWHALTSTLEDAEDRIDDAPPLTDNERAALAATPFAAPTDVAGVTVSLGEAIDNLRAQIERHREDREKLEHAVVGHLAAYRNLDERTFRETDGTIESLPSVLAIYEQLVTDDLPRAKDAWLAKVDEDMNRQLRGLLVQIDDDARAIKRGLAPINQVLCHVRFRQNATLSIEPVERPSSDLKDFRQIITRYTSNTIGVDAGRDADQVEKAFTRLRTHLAKLDEQSRSGDAWRRRVFDAREHVEFRAIEARLDGVKVVHDGVSGMSGGEGQELIAFILGAALRFRLGEGRDGPPSYASVILDEGFVKADSDYTGRALAALQALGFQLIVGAPREKATAFEDYVESVAYINVDVDYPARVRIYPMTMTEALRLEGERE